MKPLRPWQREVAAAFPALVWLHAIFFVIMTIHTFTDDEPDVTTHVLTVVFGATFILGLRELYPAKKKS